MPGVQAKPDHCQPDRDQRHSDDAHGAEHELVEAVDEDEVVRAMQASIDEGADAIDTAPAPMAATSLRLAMAAR